jgi:hypothetical protein
MARDQAKKEMGGIARCSTSGEIMLRAGLSAGFWAPERTISLAPGTEGRSSKSPFSEDRGAIELGFGGICRNLRRIPEKNRKNGARPD